MPGLSKSLLVRLRGYKVVVAKFQVPKSNSSPACKLSLYFFHLHAGLQKIGTQICFQLQPNTLFQPKNAPHTRRRRPAHAPRPRAASSGAPPDPRHRRRAEAPGPHEAASTSTTGTTSPRDALALRRPSRVPRWRRAAPSSCASSRSPAGWPRSSPLSRDSCSASPRPARRDAPASPLVLATFF